MPSLNDLIQQQFPTAKINFADLNLGVGSFPEWDSMGTFNLLMTVEQVFNVRFSPEEMAELKTVKSIRKRLEEFEIKS